MIAWHARVYNLRKYRPTTAYRIKLGKSGTRRSPDRIPLLDKPSHRISTGLRAMHGGFKVIKFPEPIDPDVVYLEEQTGALYLEKPEDVRRYSLMFDFLRAQALSPEDSAALIAQLASETA